MSYLKKFPNKEKKFILELHDVTPHLFNEFAAMLQFAHDLGASEPVIMWTPRWEGREKNGEDEEIAKKIGAAAGEVVLHGFTHDYTGSLWDRVWYGEHVGAEFKKLKREKAYDLLKQGKCLLEEWSGKPVNWFCAPRWQQGQGTVAALRDLGFKGYFKENRVVFLEGRVLPIPVVSFDHGSRGVITRVNHYLRQERVRKLLKSPRVFRLALHPRDMRRPGLVKEIKRLSDNLKSSGWTAIPLKELEE